MEYCPSWAGSQTVIKEIMIFDRNWCNWFKNIIWTKSHRIINIPAGKSTAVWFSSKQNVLQIYPAMLHLPYLFYLGLLVHIGYLDPFLVLTAYSLLNSVPVFSRAHTVSCCQHIPLNRVVTIFDIQFYRTANFVHLWWISFKCAKSGPEP